MPLTVTLSLVSLRGLAAQRIRRTRIEMCYRGLARFAERVDLTAKFAPW
jgi:hypothetical protein